MKNQRTAGQRLANALQRAWLRRTGLARLLMPLALLFGLAGSVRRQLYQRGFLRVTTVRVPVLVVGNVVAGGAGKTPLVMALVAHFRNQGLCVGVVSRGHGRLDRQCREVLPDTPASQSGDEPALIRRSTGAPVFVANRRADAASALLAAYPAMQLIICDDGLQHHALHRDLEVVVFDDRGLGNGWLLPAGPLREPWPRRPDHGLKLVLHTGSSPVFAGYTASRSLADHAIAADGTRVPLASLRQRPLAAVAAIANPQVFFSMLRSLGLHLDEVTALPDHDDFANYTPPVDAATTVLCTEKDAVKLFQRASGTRVRVLAVPLVFVPEPAFFTALDALTAPLLSPLPSRHGH